MGGVAVTSVFCCVSVLCALEFSCYCVGAYVVLCSVCAFFFLINFLPVMHFFVSDCGCNFLLYYFCIFLQFFSSFKLQAIT